MIAKYCLEGSETGFNIYGKVFSKVYDQFWDDFVIGIAPQILELLDKNKTNEKNAILDLFCGTGRLSKILLDAGYDVIGLDRSSDMLEIAKKRNLNYIKSNNANFVKGDAENFSIDKKVDFVVSTFDSINHLPDEKALINCFSSVFKCLNDNGLFIFDINTKRGLTSWNFIDIEDSKEAVLIVHGKYDGEGDRAYTKVIGFLQKDGNVYEKFEEIMYNTIFPVETVNQILKNIGWSEIYYTTEDDLFKIVDTDPESESRVFIVARKSP